MDFFNFNFIVSFLALTAVIVVGNVQVSVPISTLALPILILQVALLLLLAAIFSILNIPAPVRLSSVPSGAPIRSGVYCIIEDVVAVDGGQGETFRRQLQDRYLHSKVVQQLCLEMDLLWGITGTIFGVGFILMVTLIPNDDVVLALGEALCVSLYVW